MMILALVSRLLKAFLSGPRHFWFQLSGPPVWHPQFLNHLPTPCMQDQEEPMFSSPWERVATSVAGCFSKNEPKFSISNSSLSSIFLIKAARPMSPKGS